MEAVISPKIFHGISNPCIRPYLGFLPRFSFVKTDYSQAASEGRGPSLVLKPQPPLTHILKY